MTEQTTIYVADRIVTMNPSRPEASAVAVRDGRVLGVGSVAELEDWGNETVDERFADNVLLPGFVEAHAHSMAGALWSYPYLGYYGRDSPDGTYWPGCRSVADVLDRLNEIDDELAPDEPLLAWGVEPIYFDDGESLTAAELDEVSEERPIFVLHLNAHTASVNSALVEQDGIDEHADVDGVATDAAGDPTGVLREPTALMLVSEEHMRLLADLSAEPAIRNYGKVARNAGCTTIAELGGPQLTDPDIVDRWQRVVNDDEFPVRVSMSYSVRQSDRDHADLAEYLDELSEESTEKLRLGGVKLFMDGSIQGFSARLRWPHYYGGQSNGFWSLSSDPREIMETMLPYHEAGLSIDCHCNGDEASERFVDAVELLQRESPRFDHRHTVQHCQLATADQYRRMAALGLCVNLFSNHLYYYGDQHYEVTVGPERAERMNACATAKRAGVPFSVHSDAPVTPLAPLHTAWSAVNRVTASDRVLGDDERISVDEALRTITIDAAYLLGMDDEVGSIEAGKRADFAVLEEDPTVVDPAALKDVPVWGTVMGGDPFPAATE
ncbi:amidohydrolase [Halococcus qingdaonensis]|uniref:amidohydrolase n=1 Tax=Halococcus qingdaonensis TaxID=224402 RepID=UPI002115E3AC|nr:amidohydrolase [Halococcus qingdaonensis]